ncbi:hypothetical protein [Hydrogenimonas cancrithermarum]|uniref:Uncharacterized protein n=1 Tax=Hydrogenimonas cancrithermarum TaxID=2993563 RepID=A0ABM8FM60_9BACT|nr:hypothetical protein [Hydrogenimonas cancrithermarum]BDY13462.1 hypothetical protein HCR_17740 [Hydrogenimonas cancrithermarum]
MALHYIREDSTVRKEREEEIVVVSPSLYWYANAKFPTRSLAKARKLADAFLASRPETYRAIFVEKRGESFDCYAYDADLLARRIDETGAKNAPCYFLQQFSEQMPLRIDDGLVAEKLNGICIEMENENTSLPSLDSLDFPAIAQPCNRAERGGVGRKSLTALVALLAIAALFDLSLRYQSLHAVRKMVDDTRTERSLYEIESLVKRYESTMARQRKLRDAIKRSLQGKIGKLTCSAQKGCVHE